MSICSSCISLSYNQVLFIYHVKGDYVLFLFFNGKQDRRKDIAFSNFYTFFLVTLILGVEQIECPNYLDSNLFS